VEHNIHALKERHKVFVLQRGRDRLLKKALNNGVESGNEVFLVHVEGRTSTDIDDLEGTEKSCQDV